MELSKQEEIWKPIVGWEGHYEVSNLGRIKRLPRDFHFRYGKHLPESRISKNTLNPGGYFVVKLRYRDNYKSPVVHRLVAQAFIPNPENKPYVNHINSIKTDNRVENLEWSTPKENSEHAAKAGLYARGERNYLAVLKDKQIPIIRKSLKIGLSTTDVSILCGVSNDLIKLIRKGTIWKHVP